MARHPIRALVTFVLAVAFATAAGAVVDLPGTGSDHGKTVIYRDTWGVPHIYASSIEGGMYAIGWAQAEDRPEELLKNYMRAMGESARFAGLAGIQSDLLARIWDHYGVAQRNAEQISPKVRRWLQAFLRGVNDYYDRHPEEVPSWWGNREVDEFMITAFGCLFLYNWSINQGIGDLRRGGIEPGLRDAERGSNQLAVAPSRSAEGSALLVIDPHLSWWGISRFWEFRIHAGELRGSGFTLPGFPSIGLGHNENIAWANTTGGPDTADIYELTLHAADPSKYLYDREWRQMISREITIEIQGGGKQNFTVWDSHYGPVVARENAKAYALKMAYADAVEVVDAWYEFNFARDYRGAMAAMETLQIFPQNVMVADTSGNIYYQRTGRVPRRPEGFDWTRPVNGSTSASEWQGLHPASDHLQVLNPPQGYMQNCNIPPDAMMVDSPFLPEKTLSYLFSDRSYGPLGGWTNQRGARAVELLAADDSVTAEEMISYALDVHPYGIERWLGVLKEADGKFGKTFASDPDYAAGIADLLSWNGELRRDSTAALKYAYWRQQLIDDYGEETVAEAAKRIDDYYASVGKAAPPAEVSEEEMQAALASLSGAMAKIKADFGSLEATYGDKFRVGRDERSWPVGGGGPRSLGLSTLRSVGYERERSDHTRRGRSGQTSTQVVVLSKPIRSWTAVPIGQSDRPDSPHYTDQAEKLFSQRRMKPTWWTPAELAGHIASRTVLETAP